MRLLALALLALLVSSRAPAAETAAERLARIRAGFEELESEHAGLEAAIDDLVRVRFLAGPTLLRLGEAIAVRVEARAQRAPNAVVDVLQNCYDDHPRRHARRLRWRSAGEGRYVGTLRWRPPAAGSYFLQWQCDAGGDVPVFTRPFAVTTGRSLVLILNSTSHREPRPEPDFHALRLPFSYWGEGMLFGRRWTAEAWARFSRNARQYGDDAGVMIFLGGQYLPGDQTMLCDEPPEVRREVLRLFRRLWRMHRFPGDVEGLYTYGLSNAVAREARQEGYRLLGALCADQNWADGPFRINHWGMPARPYFVAPDDFRRAGPGGPAAMVGVQQCARQTMLCRDFNCVFAFEAGIAYALDQYHGVDSSGPVDDRRLTREARFLDCLLESAGQTGAPLMASCGFEFNGVWPDTAALNRRFMEILARRARDPRLVFSTAVAAAAYLRRHARRLPETALYLTDMFDGLTYSGKPAIYPDTVEIENHELRAIFRDGEALPVAQYDYRTPWSYPDWGNEGIPRKPNGYLVPDTDDRFRVTPRILDTRGFRVAVRDLGGDLEVTVDAPRRQERLAIAVWDAPAWLPARPVLRGARRWTLVTGRAGSRRCGILIADVRPGANRIRVSAHAPAEGGPSPWR